MIYVGTTYADANSLRKGLNGSNKLHISQAQVRPNVGTPVAVKAQTVIPFVLALGTVCESAQGGGFVVQIEQYFD